MERANRKVDCILNDHFIIIKNGIIPTNEKANIESTNQIKDKTLPNQVNTNE